MHHLARLQIDVPHRVTREVKEELLAARAHVRQNGRWRLLLRLGVLAVVKAELGEAVVVVGMLLHVFLPQELQRHVLAPHLFLEVWKQFLEHLEATVRVCGVAALEAMLQHGIVEFEKAVYAESVGKSLPYVVVCGLLVDADYLGGLAVGDTLLLQEQ